MQDNRLMVEGLHRDRSQPCAVIKFNRPMTSAELLALHRLLVHYVNGSAPTVTTGGGEV
jgi:hypothetical protein